MNYTKILFSLRGPVGLITLNSPETLNALSKKMMAEIVDLLTLISTDRSIKMVVLKASGDHFCTGHPVSDMVDANPKSQRELIDLGISMMMMIRKLPQPVIAQVQGIAAAAGCQLAAGCDLVVAEEGAMFSLPGVKMGHFCSAPMVAVSRAVGRKAAMEMVLTGRDVPAEEAKQLGLVNRVVPLPYLETETEALAETIAEAAAEALAAGKESFYRQVNLEDEPALDYAKGIYVTFKDIS